MFLTLIFSYGFVSPHLSSCNVLTFFPSLSLCFFLLFYLHVLPLSHLLTQFSRSLHVLCLFCLLALSLFFFLFSVLFSSLLFSSLLFSSLLFSSLLSIYLSLLKKSIHINIYLCLPPVPSLPSFLPLWPLVCIKLP